MSHQTEVCSFAVLTESIAEVLERAGASASVAQVIAHNCASCERDGALSHGVFRVPGYVKSLASGWANGQAQPIVERTGASFLRVDAANGFAQVALDAAMPVALQALSETGAVVIAIRDSHHHSALWPDLEPFTDAGYVAMTMVAGGASVKPLGADRMMVGTNPFGFGTPVAGSHPFIMDFATSTMSHGDLQLAARAGTEVPLGTGLDGEGNETTDAQAILDADGLLPFGGHKGAALSLMIEMLAAGLTGGSFSYREDLVFAEHSEDGGTSRTGQLLIAFDPERGGSAHYADRIREFIDALRESGVERLPADVRYAQRETSMAHGIPVTSEIRALIENTQ